MIAIIKSREQECHKSKLERDYPSRAEKYAAAARSTLFWGFGPFWRRRIEKEMRKIPYRSNGFSKELTLYIFGLKRLRCRRQRGYWAESDTGYTRKLLLELICANAPAEAEKAIREFNFHLEENINRRIYWILEEPLGKYWTRIKVEKFAPGAETFVDTTTIVFDNLLDYIDEILLEANGQVKKEPWESIQLPVSVEEIRKARDLVVENLHSLKCFRI